MRIYLQETDEFLFEISKENIWNVFLFNQKYYAVCEVRSVEEKAFVEQIEFKKDGVKELFEMDIICPYCKYEFLDSWEYEDKGEMECERCGSIFDYIREISISCSTYPNQAAEVIEIRSDTYELKNA